SSVTLSGGSIVAGGSCMFSVTVTGTQAGSWQNTTGHVTSTEGGTGATASATLVVVAPPVIAKSFGATNVALNGTTSLTFTITNPAANTAALTGVAFTDSLPAGLVVSSPNGLSGSCGGGTIVATAASGTVSLSAATIAAGGSCSFSVNVVGTTNGAKVNSVTVSSTNGGTGNTAMATLTVAVAPVIAKSFGAATIPLGGSTTLSFTITNPNASFALTEVAFTDTLPGGLVVSSPNGLSGSCGGGTITATSGAGTVSLSGATVDGGAQCVFSVNVTGSAAGVENNNVSVTSANAGPGNTASATVTVLAPPTIAKGFGASSIPFGQNTTLTFTLANPNATSQVTGVGFTDTLPAGLVVASPNGLSGSCGGGTITAVAGSGQVNLTGATLAASAGCMFQVAVTAVGVGLQSNTTSAVTSANGGTGLAATASLTVTRAPTTTTVTVAPANPGFGEAVTFTATVAASGANNSGVNPTGTVSFFLNGSTTPAATVNLNGAGQATFTTSALAAGANTVTASYSGDTNFLPSSSTTGATTTVSCTTTVSGSNGALIPGPGSTCVIGGTVTGSIVVPAGSTLDLEGVTVVGSVNVSGGGAIRICGSTIGGSVTVTGDTSFVLIGDAADGCAPNSIGGSLTLVSNRHGVQAIGNTVKGAVNASGNSGAGPFPDDTAPNISGNHP
ncbi:MAG: beta strand repeat-containing protein, partial [Acidimicrobiales bacterium]